MPPANLSLRRILALFLALLGLVSMIKAEASEAPPAVWATFITGGNQDVFAPKLLANPAGGFYFYSTGDRPLIKFNADNTIAWEIRYERGVNDVSEISELDVLENGDLIAIVTANSNPRLFGQQFSDGGTYLVQLRAGDGSAVFVKACENCAITALKARPGGGYFVGGYNWGAARIGNDQLPITFPKIFLAQFSAALDWTLAGDGGANFANYRIESIRTTGSGAGLRIFAAGTAPSPWIFSTKLIAYAGAYLITVGSTGQPIDAQVVAPEASFIALESTPSGRLHFGAESIAQNLIRRIETDGSFAWDRVLTNFTHIAAITAGEEPVVIGTFNGPSKFAATTAFDTSGNLKWQRIEAGRDISEGYGVAALGDGRLAIAGLAHAGGGVLIDDFLLNDLTRPELDSYGAFVATLETRSAAAPVFREQPRDQKFALRGETVTLHAKVFSSGSVTFIWYKDGKVIPNQTSSDLILPAVQAGDRGVYFLETRNAVGVTRSRSVQVDVNTVSVTTISGTDAPGAFVSPRSPIILPDESIVLSDSSQNVIKRVTTNGVTAFAGVGQPGLANGAAAEALFSSPRGLAIETRYYGPIVYVADQGNDRVRRIHFSATTGEATTVDQADFVLPTVGSVAAIEGLAYFVAASSQSNGLWKPEGQPIATLAGAFTNSAVSALAFDIRGNLYIADSALHEIRRRTPAGEIEHVATIADPTGIAIDDSGNLFVTDRATHTIQKISPSGVIAPVVAGGLLNAPEGLCFRGNSLIVADTGNHCLREIKFEPAQTVVTGTARITATLGTFLRVGVAGNVGEQYAIESSAQIGPAASWQGEGTVSIGQVTSELLLPKPSATRFYRARKIQ